MEKRSLSTREVADLIGRKQDFVRELALDGRLEVHADSAFGKRKSNRYTRRSVVAYLARIK